MEKFDNTVIKVGKLIFKILCLIILMVVLFFVGKLAYKGFSIVINDPYSHCFLGYNFESDIVYKVPPRFTKTLAGILPFDYVAEEYFCAILSSMAVILIFASVIFPRIVYRSTKDWGERSVTIPYLALLIEAITIPFVYHLNIHKDISWWIIKDIVIVFIELAVLNWFNWLSSRRYGWKKYLSINIVIALSYGIISMFFLYQMFELWYIVLSIFLLVNLLPIIPFFM